MQRIFARRQAFCKSACCLVLVMPELPRARAGYEMPRFDIAAMEGAEHHFSGLDSNDRASQGWKEVYAHKHLRSAVVSPCYSRVTRVIAVRFELSSSFGGFRCAACRAYTEEASMTGRRARWLWTRVKR